MRYLPRWERVCGRHQRWLLDAADGHELERAGCGGSKQRWAFRTGGSVFSTPAVADGVVYVGSDDNHLYAVDAVTGKKRWAFRTGSGVESSPAVVGGVVYVGSKDSMLYALQT
jgi:outer membrane protein assembly factor BamB